MQRHPALHPLSWGHHHGLQWVVRLKRDTPTMEGDALAGRVERLRRFWEADLQGHFRAEEELLLARLEARPGAADLVEQTWKEHARLQELLEVLWKGGDETRVRENLLVFAGELESHIHFEERKLFPFCEKQLGQAGLAAVARELQAREIGQKDPVLPDPVLP